MFPDIPRFSLESIDSNLGFQVVGDAFQHFVHGIAQPEFGDLHLFETGGKDGGIDLLRDTTGDRAAIACKHIGQDGASEATKRWKQAAKDLETNITPPDGPAKGQGQYQPWYDAVNPIRNYYFWISSELENTSRKDDLRKEIETFFTFLAENHLHLAHLKGMSVTVRDWSDCCAVLEIRPHLIFRWFPATRPDGLVPLDEMPAKGTFREYLTSAKLPYYSRSAHLLSHPAPQGADVPDEREMLRRLEQDSACCMVINGAGGLGKTRLMFEVGRVALEEGWLVLRARWQLEQAALENLAARLVPDTKVLLLVDYLETQTDFDALIEYIDTINQTYGFQVNCVSTCRSSYYNKIEFTLPLHVAVALPEPDAPTVGAWYDGYFQSTILHILGKSGIELKPAHVETCKGLPILAVFMSYLHDMGKEEELQGLLSEHNFGVWLTKRLQLSFGTTDISGDLARLVAMLPIPDESLGRVMGGTRAELFDRLTADRWIERMVGEDERGGVTWEPAHDVFVDQILIEYLGTGLQRTREFVRELLREAAEVGTLQSVLITLQRIGDNPNVASLDWPKILEEQLSANPEAWRTVRTMLVRTSLLQPQQRIHLLSGHEAVWQGAEGDVPFQNCIGWLARWVQSVGVEIATPSETETVVGWLTRMAPHITTSNYILKWALLLRPEQFHDHALQWIADHPRLFQTHYLLVAWLRAGLPAIPLLGSLGEWLSAFPTVRNVSFVVASWLDAQGNKELVTEPIRLWLRDHQTALEANYVYKAWLDAQDNKELVTEPIREWLKQHQTAPAAQFVYEAWLDEHGEKELVAEPIRLWLQQHQTAPAASHVYKSWLDEHGEKELVVDPIRLWLEEHQTSAEADFVYKAWLDAKGDKELVAEPIRLWLRDHQTALEANYVYKAWLDAQGDKDLVTEPIREWLKQHQTAPEASHVYPAWLDAQGDKALVAKPIREWLGEHQTALDARFVYRAWLDARGDKELVADPIRLWLTEHQTTPQAGFVYRAWLDARGDKALVAEPIRLWLQQHGGTEDVDFLLRAWLEAGGDFGVIKNAAISWLRDHCQRQEATFLIKPLTKERELPEDAVRYVLTWCRAFPTDEDVLWRFTRLNRHLLKEEMAEDVYSTAQAVLEPAFRQDILDATTGQQITKLFTIMLDAPGLQFGDLRNRVDFMFLSWLRHPASFEAEPAPGPWIQRRVLVERVRVLVVSGRLDVCNDAAALKRFLQWVNAWDPTRKAEVAGIITYLQANYPADDLWDAFKPPPRQEETQ